MPLNYYTEFLTATIYNWSSVLKNDDYKQIILNSFDWLVNSKKCAINCFVIMPNHVHLLWKISDGFERKDVQGALFSFTGTSIQKALEGKRSETPGKLLCK